MILIISTTFLALVFTIIVIIFKFKWLNTSLKGTTNKIESSRPTSSIDDNKEELKSIFATFDKNNDGFITKQELKDSLNSIGIFMQDKDIAEMMKRVDENSDGLIDLNEFCELCNSFLGEKEEDLREAFEVFDGDTDGLITAEELSNVLGSLGLKQGKTLEDCKEMIKKFDLDGDGMVNFDEFRRMMTQRLIPIF